jgi:glycosyltransferase involved in cell wall biosynthesis
MILNNVSGFPIPADPLLPRLGAPAAPRLRPVEDGRDPTAAELAAVEGKSIAVLLPCYNEEASIAAVVESFRRALPSATIYVYDNNSTDRTAALAAAAGAIVRREPFQGKGYVMRRMFADIEADIYVMADGDLTYDASAAGRLVAALVDQNVDMVVGSRVGPDGTFPRGHRFGNRFFNLVVARLFGDGLTDILSGYRVLSRRFAKSFPAASTGFEIETELSVHALDLKLATTEVPLPYGKRVENSVSKLRTFRDGFRILFMILRMFRTLRPFQYFGAISLALTLAALVLIAPVLLTYLETGLVPRLPTAVLSAALMQLAFLSLTCGFITDAIGTTRREIKRMRYLDLPAPAIKQV